MYPTGPDWWIDQFADVELTEDRWIKAMEIKPSNPKIVHHVVVYAIEPDAPEGTPETGVMLHEYAVGKYGDIFGENTGRLLKKGTRLRYDMHYFAIGVGAAQQDDDRVQVLPEGLRRRNTRCARMAIRNIPNDELEVPPNTVVRTTATSGCRARRASTRSSRTCTCAAAAMTLEAIDPVKNRTQILSSVDHFDFNWHINYVYADDAAPLLPAGTVLHMIGIHDNTPANRRNPDPNMWVGFGERSVDDMLQVWLNIVYLDDAEYPRLVEDAQEQADVDQRQRAAETADGVPQAGGIVFRRERDAVSILLVTAKREPTRGSYPKGTSSRANPRRKPRFAKRMKKPASPASSSAPSVSRSSSTTGREFVRVQYFLIRAVSESPHPTDAPSDGSRSRGRVTAPLRERTPPVA